MGLFSKDIKNMDDLFPYHYLMGQATCRDDCAAILQQTLDEEKATDKKLTAMAEGQVNRRAA